jgi:catechol 2,3-dioxygenase-like lactoylglutathione lyase family enzyme
MVGERRGESDERIEVAFAGSAHDQAGRKRRVGGATTCVPPSKQLRGRVNVVRSNCPDREHEPQDPSRRTIMLMPRLARVLETVLYLEEGEEEPMRGFYGETLALERVTDGAYRLGVGLILLFDREKSSRKTSPPPHGTWGAAHVGLVAAEGDYEAWKKRLAAAGVELIEEIDWPRGPRSFYFRDPAGNVLEIADGNMWPVS